LRRGADTITTLAFIFSYPVLFSLVYGQIDWIVFLGIFLKPQIGLFLILAKPQLGIGLALYWFFTIWHKEGMVKLTKTFSPVFVGFLLSMLIYGFWPARYENFQFGSHVNSSLWPLSIPIGLIILILATRKANLNISLISSPFLSPYVAPHAWSGAILGLIPDRHLVITASIGSWIVRILTNQFLN
jgi:hypothetical protein